LIQINFWVSIVSLFFAYLTAECWLGVTYSMINQIVQTGSQGLAIAVFHICGALSGAIVTLILGILGDAVDATEHPERFGYIMGGAVLMSYISCFPSFIAAGRAFERAIKRM
jgi:hypothetical protein